MFLTALLLSTVGAAAVWFAGRRDAARDPRLTLVALCLLATLPLLHFLPEWKVLPPAEAGPRSATDGTDWIVGLWVAGVLVFSLRLVRALVALHGWRIRSEKISDIAGVEVRLLEELTGPVAAGIFRPVIFVPAAWHDWTPALREAVLAHELQHHQRKDPLWRSVAAVACTLHWFNPLVWWMARRLAEQCEYACDEAVVAAGLRADTYAGFLCDLAAPAPSPATTLAMAHEHGLESRVRRMFSPAPGGPAWVVATLLAVVPLAALALAVVKRADPPAKPAIPAEEIRTRLSADPFPGEK